MSVDLPLVDSLGFSMSHGAPPHLLHKNHHKDDVIVLRPLDHIKKLENNNDIILTVKTYKAKHDTYSADTKSNSKTRLGVHNLQGCILQF